jgi:hypothetical protein
MNTVKMRHPELDEPIEVPASAVPYHAAAGWGIDDSQGAPPPCPTCGRPWPTQDPPRDADKQTEAPAESGASSSEPPSRRKSSKGSD